MNTLRRWFLESSAKNYALVALLLLAGWILSKFAGEVLHGLDHGGDTLLVFFEVVVILIFGFLAYECAKPTVIPSFVLAIFIGMLQRESLAPLVQNPAVLTVLTTTGAAFILFGGGLDTPFGRFRKIIGPILSLAFLGTLVTAFLLSLSFQYVAAWQGYSVSIGAIVLLGAALASTDPAAIIPSLKSLVFPKPRVKDMAISESAINDVVGAVLTITFLAVLGAATVAPASIVEVYGHLLTFDIGFGVVREIVIGCVVGGVGFAILHAWSRWKAALGEGGEADAALFMAVPLLTYLVAVFLHGNGFLAVFVAGLLFQLEEHVSHVEHFFVHTIEGLMKPLIFMLLGATVDVQQLLGVAPLGIAMGALFMFVIRPIAVFATLAPFMPGRHKLSVKELLFLSFVRETGVIPAVLLMGLGAANIPGTETVVLVGLWIILLTLIVQPPLTPFVAKALGIAKDASAFPKRNAKGPIAVLCSRGRSFIGRMPAVVDWADQHGVDNVTLLHCPEEKHSSEYIAEINIHAQSLFTKMNAARVEDGKKELHFEFLGRPGLLQDNIRELVKEDEVAIIFVGDKMLDYRLDDVKKLRVPFVFVP